MVFTRTPAAAHSGRGRFTERQHAAACRRRVSEVRPAVPDVGDHVHDGAAVRLHPLGVDLAHDDEATGQVVAHHGLETLGADGFQGCAVLTAGVVEQPVDASVFGQGSRRRRRSTVASSRMSAAWIETRPPSEWISACTASSLSTLRPTIATSAPSAAEFVGGASPDPTSPPVITTVRSANRSLVKIDW